MINKEQQNFEGFKIILKETIKKEEIKLSFIRNAKDLTGDKDLNLIIERREKFLHFCSGSSEHLEKINEYKGNEKYIDGIQKDFYLTSDGLKKEALKLMAKNQKIWFTKLFDNNFDSLKSLLRSLLISETQSDITTMERIVHEIELVRYK